MLTRLTSITGRRWRAFWMRFASPKPLGRLATRLASWGAPALYERARMASLSPHGYIDPLATIAHPLVRWGRHDYLGERVMLYRDMDGGPIELADRVFLYGDTTILTGQGGSVCFGTNTHVQPRCQFSAFVSAIRIGSHVQIAPGCAFYSYDHSTAPDRRIVEQPLVSRGPISIEDDVWIGYGSIVLSGVTIGTGAVIGAGSIVTHDIPAGAIAVGAPARVIRMRSSLEPVGLPDRTME